MCQPYVVINSAMTADGKISTKNREQTKISSKEDFLRVKELRNDFDAIMVGVGTVLADDPKLQGDDLIRVVADSLARTPTDSNIFNKENVVLATTKNASRDRLKKLEEKAEIIVVGKNRVNLEELLTILRKKGVNKLLVEGGGTLNWGFLSTGLVDELITYVGNFVFGGERSPTLVDGEGVDYRYDAIELELNLVQELGSGVLIKWGIKER